MHPSAPDATLTFAQAGMTGAARRWKPTPLVMGAAALHAGAAAAVASYPASWPWAAAGAAAAHAAIAASGLLPRSNLLGPNLTRLPASAGNQIAITIDDGPDPEVTPRVLDLLDGHGARATFFCIGETARRHPRLIEDIVARGHAVENHSQHHHLLFSLCGPRSLRRDIEAAQRTLTEISGARPLFFRPPAGLRNPFLEPVLCALGLNLASWTRRGFDTCARGTQQVAQSLLRGLSARDILLLHDGNAGRDAGGRPLILDVLPIVLQAAQQAGLGWTTLRAAVSADAAAVPAFAQADAMRPE
ncbi:MAG: polysaccharide deacetylase family protein [Bordetella sp.]|uniref:polysaccharide deacetylase family protein n=1 Tax=Bordetella sp. TaxID=28081 RepID=UPI003F7B809B